MSEDSKEDKAAKRAHIEEQLLKNKPELSKNTIRGYVSILANIPGFDGNAARKDYLCDVIDKRNISSRKTAYSALVAYLGDDTVHTEAMELYREKLMADSKAYAGKMREQLKSKTQSENWLDYGAVKAVYDALVAKAKPVLAAAAKSPEVQLSVSDFNTVQDLVILSLTGGVWLPPRRSLDWVAFKIRNPDQTKDNFISKGHLVFQVYKTSKQYGDQTIKIPTPLKTLLAKWMKINRTDHMLTINNEKAITGPYLTQRLHKIFDGKKISTSMLRHIYLSERYKDIPALAEMQQIAADMAHSVPMALEYIKRDAPAEST